MKRKRIYKGKQHNADHLRAAERLLYRGRGASLTEIQEIGCSEATARRWIVLLRARGAAIFRTSGHPVRYVALGKRPNLLRK